MIELIPAINIVDIPPLINTQIYIFQLYTNCSIIFDNGPCPNYRYADHPLPPPTLEMTQFT